MASYAFISDLHIKKAHDEPSKVLRSFFSHEKVQNSDVVFLLGDIFDFLIGEHKAYIKEYAFFFESILELIENGKVIYFFEGNHDFHFSNTITSFLKSKTTNYQNFKYLKQGIFLKLDTKKVPENAEEILISNGEVMVPDIIAQEIGYKRLEKMNNRGKELTELDLPSSYFE